MQFEQLVIPTKDLNSFRIGNLHHGREFIFENGNLFERSENCNYLPLANDGKVYCKIDWLTVMFFDSTMNDVLKWLHLEDCVTDFCLSRFEQSRGYDQVFKFIYNGVMLETSTFSFYGEDLDVSIFDTVCPKIRLELSGSALDYLRSIGVDMNEYRLVVPELGPGGSYHFTRCDWAFDFINYKPDFVDRMIDHINTHKLPSERIPLASTRGAISCKLVTCGQKTIYLGSPQSDRMLRVYDKRMQHLNLTTQTYCKPNPYGDPDSWFRIEWQTRNKFANTLVHGYDEKGVPADFKSILKDIFDRYAFADGTIDARNKARPCVDFWLSLFDWSDLEKRIIQNAKYVQYESSAEKIVKSFESVCIRTFILWYSLVGREAAEKRINEYLRSLDLPDPINQRRNLAFLNKLNQTPEIIIDFDSSRSGLWSNCGRLYFKL